MLSQAEAKFQRKGCDLLFANPIDQQGVGFASANQGWLLSQGASPEAMGPCSNWRWPMASWIACGCVASGGQC